MSNPSYYCRPWPWFNLRFFPSPKCTKHISNSQLNPQKPCGEGNITLCCFLSTSLQELLLKNFLCKILFPLHRLTLFKTYDLAEGCKIHGTSCSETSFLNSLYQVYLTLALGSDIFLITVSYKTDSGKMPFNILSYGFTGL